MLVMAVMVARNLRSSCVQSEVPSRSPLRKPISIQQCKVCVKVSTILQLSVYAVFKCRSALQPCIMSSVLQRPGFQSLKVFLCESK